ncbi:MAG: cupin domain-containing protein [Gemmatimonadota bacterium]
MRSPRIALVLAFLLGGTSVAALHASSVMDELLNTTVYQWSTLRAQESASGSTRQYFDRPTSSLLGLALRARTVAPGATPHPIVPNSGPRELVLIVKEGVLEIKLGDKAPVKIDAGSAVFLASNQVYFIRNKGTTPATYYEFNWLSPGMAGERQY